ncbi:DUF1189 domain-containing protein [Parageobacillus thermoglucosidasius]|uniref:DUF1189 domain-containing protein n=1 Tax=Parageobacillus thermoglucosidasius TaxID=1426 RepID=UPI0027F3AE4C|nr:DUF1189 domain-containing protein [Parageobacillus thermoglucosidasius]
MNMFVQLWKSLYSPKDIARFRFQGIGKTIGYVFLLTFLSILPMAYYLTTSFVEGIRNTSALLQNELPSFTIENGQLHSSAKEPVHIDQHGFTIVFDSTGQVTKEDVERFNNAIGLLKHEAVLIANHQSQYYSYSAFPDVKITDKDVHSFIETLQSLLPVFIPLLFIIIYLFASASKFIGICILAFFGLILRSTLDKKLQYRHTWIMSAYSVTLSTVFFAVMEALQTAVPYAAFIHWFVSIVVLFLAMKEVPSSRPHNE